MERKMERRHFILLLERFVPLKNLFLYGWSKGPLPSSSSPSSCSLKGQTSATELLLVNGAKVEMKDEEENTPLHVAAIGGITLLVYSFCLLYNSINRAYE